MKIAFILIVSGLLYLAYEDNLCDKDVDRTVRCLEDLKLKEEQELQKGICGMKGLDSSCKIEDLDIKAYIETMCPTPDCIKDY